MVYAIHDSLFPELENRLGKISRKCEKYGNKFTFEVKGEEFRKETTEWGVEISHKFILVEVEGTAKIDEWECIAVMEAIPSGGNVIRKINTEIDVPDRFRYSENICEHCNTKRQRTHLYVIHNTVTDDYKQVGGSCLKLYTGGLSMEYVAHFLDGITELEKYDGYIDVSGSPYYPVREVLNYAVEVIGKLGYFSRDSFFPTKYIVSRLMGGRLDKALYDINYELSKAKVKDRLERSDFFKRDTESTVNAIMEYYKGLEDNSDFTHNVKVMLESGFCTRKHFGYLTYLPFGYSKHLATEEQRKVREEAVGKSEHFGEVGKRYKDMPIQSFVCASSWSTEYGVTYLFKILVDGKILMWKTSNPCVPCSDECYDKITFTVKEHTEYKGEQQTEVTRCKVTYQKKENRI